MSTRWGFTRDDGEVVALVLSQKVLLLFFVCASYVIHKNQWIRSWQVLLEMIGHWDADQYRKIATIGYGPTGEARLRLAFFPLYPGLMKLAGLVIPNALVSGLLISNFASLVLGLAFWKLVVMDFPEDVAHRAVWFLFIFPTAYFLDLPYTESLLLALVAGSFLFARRNEWLLAGVCGGLAALTHDTGLLLFIALGIEAYSEFMQTKKIEFQLLWLSLIPVGFCVYLLVNYSATGNPFAFVTVESSHWANRLGYPWMILHQVRVVTWMNPAGAETIGVQTLFFVILSLAATVASMFILRPSYSVWMLTNWLIIAGQSWDLSAPRLVLALFPMFIIMALAGRNRLVFGIISMWSILFLALFAGEFVLGHWAF
jgi:hypothetical protein